MEKQIADTARGLGIVVGATVLLATAFGVAGAVYGPIGEVETDMFDIIRYGQLALTVMAAVQGSVMNRALTAKLEKAGTDEAKLAVYKTRALIVVAGAEGAALFAGIALLLTGPHVLTVPAFVLFAVVTVVMFPTPARVRLALTGKPAETKDKYA
ncbi:MAG: hypothetical protein IT464_15555 [Planctomycetes bacterium]|nr:hypothetical protein [Planctomycetota bacterium]